MASSNCKKGLSHLEQNLYPFSPILGQVLPSGPQRTSLISSFQHGINTEVWSQKVLGSNPHAAIYTCVPEQAVSLHGLVHKKAVSASLSCAEA